MLLIKPSMQVSTMYVANHLSKGNIHGVAKLLHTVWAATAIICLSLAVIGNIVALLFKASDLEWVLKYPDIPRLISSVAIFACFRLFSEVQIGGLHGYQRYDRAAQVNFSIRIANLISALIMMYNSVDLATQFYVWTSFQAIGIFVFFRVYRSLGIRPKFKIDANEFQNIQGYAKHSLLQNFISIAYFQIDRFIVAYKFGAISAGYYSIVSTIFNQMHRAFEAAINWFFPKMAGYKDDPEMIQSFFYAIRGFSLIMGVSILLLFYYTQTSFMVMWLGESTYASLSPLIPFFILLECTYLFSICGNLFMLGRNEMRLNTTLEWTYKSFVIVAMFIGAILGNAAHHVVMAMGVAMIIGMVIYNFAFFRKRNWSSAYKETIVFTLFSLTFCFSLITENSWLHYISLVSSLAILYLHYIRGRVNFKTLLDG